MVYALDINKKILNLVNSRRDKKFSKNVYNYKIDITNENEVKNFFFKKKKLDGVINAAAIDPKIGEKSFIGLGSNIIDKIRIGKNVDLGAGSLVNKQLKSNSLYYGVPAKLKR